MRILETSPRRLILEDRPVLLAVILGVVIVFLMFLAMATVWESFWLGFALVLMAALFGGAMVIFVRRVIVIFDRDAGSISIRTTSLLGRSETSHPLARLSRASVETSISRSTSSSGRRSTTSQTHRTVLHLDSETVPLTMAFSSGGGADRMATAINGWLGQ